ncbi:hypothetical protein NLX83_00605 [Allokutzneria sp. A3M-2-11 16]|uniref:hypothetical protein n=1 Tax=Allokutzneria sp. A3M-2-11 16 TaxID=2962043 RepID=UPI0020B76A4E|nr:hypothetical protein [Allokutzneria sp. A3M-2-11 16]MCP3797748.1 hypothetical protein [Allokutzneria sp. A3M-2-11 16]
MLYVVLLLVLAAFGLLVLALASGTTGWAWGSVALSVAAAVVLVLDWARRRRRDATAGADERAGEAKTADTVFDAVAGAGANSGPDDAAAEAVPESDSGRSRREPAEEDTDAADLLVVAGLTDEVLVVDERPRYHLPSCEWVRGHATMPLPVREARELGFTPCALCTPDAVLATVHRTSRAR